MEGWRRVVLAGLFLTLVMGVAGCGPKRSTRAPAPPPAGGKYMVTSSTFTPREG